MFRVIVTGDRRFLDYRRLRDALDAALADRLPDVTILTAGGPGADVMAACYAAARRLPVVIYPERWDRFPADAPAERDKQLAADADAAVVVWDGACRRDAELIARCRRRVIPVKVVAPRAKAAARQPDPDPPPRPYTRLPD